MTAASALLAVFVGGGLGSVLRYGLARWAIGAGREALWATLGANVLACLLLGFLMSRVELGRGWLAAPQARLLLAVGLCGGFSTFSTFSLEALSLVQVGRPGAALAYVLGSVTLGVAGVWVAWVWGR